MYAYSGFAKSAVTVALIGALSLTTTLARALDLFDGDLQVHGFLMQSLINTDDNNFLGRSKDRFSTDFREIGVNASWRATPEVQLSAELLSHRAGGTDDGDLRLDYGLVDWTPYSSESGRGGVRFGRVKTSYGLYNKTRDVPFTRPSVILPQSIYFERTRNLTVSADGGEIYVENYGGGGLLSASFALGLPHADTESARVALVGLNRPGRLESDLASNFQLLYEEAGGKYRVSLTAARLDLRYKPGAGDSLRAGRLGLTPVVFSAQYNAEKWSLTGEYAVRRTSARDFGPFFYNGRADGESYYLQGTYQLAPRWEALLRYDAYYADRSDRNGRDFAAATRVPAFTRFAKDWTTGVRFDVTPAFMLRAEAHRVDGAGFLPAQDNPNPLALRQKWNLFMLLGSFRF
ncbi:MAG TPA: hypothetical protein PLS67_05350 [Accumulibacter sp.]|jgi:hypothetical protein|nr:hypothetical protein [Accumulibacter sp.]HQC79932.1 hypothetical protein [Accumulibacter sp.]